MFWNLGIVSTLMRLLLLDCFGGNNEEVDFEGFAWNSTNVLVLSNFKSAHLEVKAQMLLQFHSFEKKNCVRERDCENISVRSLEIFTKLNFSFWLHFNLSLLV